MEIIPGVHQVEGVWGCSVYLLMDEDQSFLIDTGFPGNANRILRYMANVGAAQSSQLTVLLTHGHPDHTGTVRALRRHVDVTVMAHKDDLKWDRGRPWLHYSSQPLAREWNAPLFQKPFVDQPFEDGATLPVLGGLKLVHSPGHTAGSVAYYLEKQGILFSGDTLLGLSKRLVRPFPFPGTSFQRYRWSMEQLLNLDFDTVCPGHGRPLVGRGRERLRQMLDHYRWAMPGLNRLRQFAELLTPGSDG